MASIRLAIHIPPDSNPENIAQLINILAQDTNLVFQTASELMEFLQENGIGSRSEIHITADEMGIIEKKPNQVKLSSIGCNLSRIREEARPDLFHYLMYTGWSEHKPTHFLQSWAYQRICNQYWEMGDVDISANTKRLVEEITNEAGNYFTGLVEDFSEISFSSKSINGAHKWLDSINPQVLEKSGKEYRRFKRREFCPPELLIMAIGYILRDDPDATNIDILLSKDKRDKICQLCLLEPTALERTLDWTLPIYPSIIKAGTTAGYYGRFIRLLKHPTLEDLIR